MRDNGLRSWSEYWSSGLRVRTWVLFPALPLCDLSQVITTELFVLPSICTLSRQVFLYLTWELMDLIIQAGQKFFVGMVTHGKMPFQIFFQSFVLILLWTWKVFLGNFQNFTSEQSSSFKINLTGYFICIFALRDGRGKTAYVLCQALSEDAILLLSRGQYDKTVKSLFNLFIIQTLRAATA